MGVLGYNAEKHLQVIQDESYESGEENLAKLCKWLLANDRVSDVQKVCDDREYRKKLLEEFLEQSNI